MTSLLTQVDVQTLGNGYVAVNYVHILLVVTIKLKLIIKLNITNKLIYSLKITVQ